jgi:SAM-dependent methyltransferase
MNKLSLEEVEQYWNLRIKMQASYEGVLWQDIPSWNEYIDNLQKHYLKRYIHRLRKSDIVLDVGCGIGRFAFRFADVCGEAIGIDLSEEAIKICNEKAKKYPNTNFRVMNVTNLEFDKETFDYVFCITSVSAITDIGSFVKAIKEILRVTKKPGTIIFLEHIYEAKAKHLISLTREDFFRIINESGGRIVKWSPVDLPILRNFVFLSFMLITKLTRRGWKIDDKNPIEKAKKLPLLLERQPKMFRAIEYFTMYVLTLLIKSFEYSIPKIFTFNSQYVLAVVKK